jgi:histidinol-phosphatase (PHP family)
MRPDRLHAYVEEVLGVARDSDGPVVRLGLEVDWFDGHGAAIAAALEGVPFDLLIGSVHEVDGFVVDVASADWERLDEGRREALHRGYWRSLASLASSGLFDVVGHLDLPKKFNQSPRANLSVMVDAALDAIRDADLVVELNTAGWHTPGRDAYPSVELLQACRRRDIPVTLSADAHHPKHLRRDFERGLERLWAMGYRELARFAGKRRWFDPVELVATELARVP